MINRPQPRDINASEADLSRKCHASRQTALKECEAHYETEHAARKREIQAEMAAVDVKLAERKAAANTAVRETHRSLHRAFVDSFYKAAAPLVQSFTEDGSRKTVAQLVSLLATFNAREQDELGQRHGGKPRAVELLALAFADVALRATPNLANVLGPYQDPRFGEALALLARSADSSAMLQHAIEELERALGRIAEDIKGQPVHPGPSSRYAFVRALDDEGAAAFDRDCEQKRAAAAHANYQPVQFVGPGGTTFLR